MRFSLYLNPQTPGPQSDAQIIDESISLAVRADEAGFAGVCLTQHHFSDYNTYVDSMMFGAHLAAHLKRSWVLLQVAVAPLFNPLNLAERANLLDQLLKGRLIVGIGTGGSPLEFEGFGRDPEQRYSLTEEVMDVAERVWARKPGDPPLEYRTPHDFGTLRGRIMPGPCTSGRPHLAKAALSEPGWREAGKLGRPLFFGRVGLEGARTVMKTYNEALEEAGHDAGTRQFCRDWTTMQKTVLFADTDEEARAAIDAPLGNLHRLSVAAFSAYGAKQREKVTGVSGDDPAAFKKAFVEGATIIGSPATVIDTIRQYEEAGVQHIALHMQFGFMDASVANRSLDLFLSEVLPHFQADTKAPLEVAGQA